MSSSTREKVTRHITVVPYPQPALYRLQQPHPHTSSTPTMKGEGRDHDIA